MKRKHENKKLAAKRVVVTPKAKPAIDLTYYDFGCSIEGLREDLGLERYRHDIKTMTASVEENDDDGGDSDDELDDEALREKMKRRRKAAMEDIHLHPFMGYELDHRCVRAQMPGWDPHARPRGFATSFATGDAGRPTPHLAANCRRRPSCRARSAPTVSPGRRRSRRARSF